MEKKRVWYTLHSAEMKMRMLGFQRCRLPGSHTPRKTPEKRLMLDRLVVWEKCRILFKRICIAFKNGNYLLKLRSFFRVSRPALIDEVAECQRASGRQRRSSILQQTNRYKTEENNDRLQGKLCSMRQNIIT